LEANKQKSMLPILAIIVLLVYFMWKRQKDMTELPYVESAKSFLGDTDRACSLSTVGLFMIVIALGAYVTGCLGKKK